VLDFFLAITPLMPSMAVMYLNSNKPSIHTLYKVLFVSIGGFFLTNYLIPIIAEYTLMKGLHGKDLGKKGSKLEDKLVPEALGLVPATVFLMCAIIFSYLFAKTDGQLVLYNSALFSVCFMTFLGFVDDTLELKWRYKLILPTVASLPLLAAYTGDTALFVPPALRFFLVRADGSFTTLSIILNFFVTVDADAKGAIVEFGWLFLLFMGMLAVFCANSINILAGINGLECGQSYVIGCAILFFKIYDLVTNPSELAQESALFVCILVLPFIFASLALLKHNWCPASVFVGDTFCYFAGMTFAVLGILGHFSKTLLLLFLPQVFNFVYSLPQLAKIIPCPRHRLPRTDAKTGLMHCSTFPCKADEYRWFKASKDATECPNYTLICVVLRFFGPMKERSLSLILLTIQVISSIFAFYVRYILFEL
jgi:UDP-N-acetylglucosamine--dolichyl-phosphate N-acetylglucosaminephosphotransferase